jgi:pimeloyl-ACP methyl ester carboxylesterase
VARPYRIPGLVLTDHEFSIPLDHAQPDGDRITVFAREVADPDGLDRPFLVYFQGGPGHEGPRPTRVPGGLWREALSDFRLLMLDQRGTGCSTPVGSLDGMTPHEQADYLAHLRADSIVRDAEWIRRELGVERWSIMGQSFGGFCLLNYLSTASEGLREAFFTGGLPPVGRPVDDVYRATFERVLERCRRYYEMFPEDRDRVREIHERLETEDVRLPSGDPLTSRRFRVLGHLLGAHDGPERLHYTIERPFGSPAFLQDVEDETIRFGRNPLYAAVHEACYADGGPTRWSAQRVQPADYQDDPTLFTGEHVFPWMFEDYGAIAPLREAAELLAERDWPRLYDADRLAANEVPAAAAIYVDDMYVEREFSEETAALVRGLKPWITNEYEHNGLRADGARIFGRLRDLARGKV